VIGIIAWVISDSYAWGVGSIFLISVVPITLLFIKPINDQLLNPTATFSSEQVERLLAQWNPRHWVRTIASGIAFVLFLIGLDG
jgi:uncharacterized membrane protein